MKAVVKLSAPYIIVVNPTYIPMFVFEGKEKSLSSSNTTFVCVFYFS